MPIQKSEAIVLKRTEFRETSLITTFYTPTFGKIRGIIKGIRNRENRHEGTLDLGSVNWIVFYEKPLSEIYLVSQVELKQVWHSLSHRLERLLYLQLILEEMEFLTPLHEPAPELYELLYKTLQALSNPFNDGTDSREVKKVTRYFETQMIACFGVKPQLDNCLVCRNPIEGDSWISFSRGGLLCRECHPGEVFSEPVSFETVDALRQLTGIHVGANDYLPLRRLIFSERTHQELGDVLRGLIEHHVEKPLRSAKITEAMLL